jgi:hypothetical protein
MKRLEEYRKQVIFVADFYTPDTIRFKLFFYQSLPRCYYWRKPKLTLFILDMLWTSDDSIPRVDCIYSITYGVKGKLQRAATTYVKTHKF